MNISNVSASYDRLTTPHDDYYGGQYYYIEVKIKYLMRFFCVMFSLESFYYKSRVVYGVNVYIKEHNVFRLLKKNCTNNEK